MEAEMDDGAGETNSLDINARSLVEQQLSELEMLQSIFTSKELTLDQDLGDLVKLVDNSASLNDDKLVSLIIERECRIGFLVKLPVNGLTVEVKCDLPLLYPSKCKPNIYICTAQFSSRMTQQKFRKKFDEYLNNLELNETIVFSVLDWIKDNLPYYVITPDLSVQTDVIEKTYFFTRMWLYSHHIYSKLKRRDIINWAAELKLQGFSMCGKPGVICLEGYTDDVEEFWSRIRRLQWKRLVMKEREDVPCSNAEEVIKQCRFGLFEEKFFGTQSGKSSVSFHSDIGDLNTFLQEHGCGHMFEMYFGVEGKALQLDS